jgi:uncharacterized membrane-anchored protein YhcB (DUF1043 family)
VGIVDHFEKAAEILKQILPLDDSVNQESVRKHTHATAERSEKELGEEQQLMCSRVRRTSGSNTLRRMVRPRAP